MNVLSLVPPFKRHLNQFRKAEDTDSKLAAYIADGIEALGFRWTRTYAINVIEPETYLVSPDVVPKDKRPIILMGSIIYKMGNVALADFTDQDFSYHMQQGRQNPLQVDIEELARFLPVYRLASATTSPLRGYSNIFNPESYQFYLDALSGLGILL